MNEDLSNIFEKLNINKDSISPEMIDNILNIVNNSNSNTANASNESIDIETIMKIKSILDKINNKSNDPRSMLLAALRPYLKDDKKNKLDQYIQMSKIIDILPLIGGELNNGNK